MRTYVFLHFAFFTYSTSWRPVCSSKKYSLFLFSCGTLVWGCAIVYSNSPLLMVMWDISSFLFDFTIANTAAINSFVHLCFHVFADELWD